MPTLDATDFKAAVGTCATMEMKISPIDDNMFVILYKEPPAESSISTPKNHRPPFSERYWTGWSGFTVLRVFDLSFRKSPIVISYTTITWMAGSPYEIVLRSFEIDSSGRINIWVGYMVLHLDNRKFTALTNRGGEHQRPILYEKLHSKYYICTLMISVFSGETIVKQTIALI